MPLIRWQLQLAPRLLPLILCIIGLSAEPVFADAKKPPAAAVASAHPLATAAGETILQAGGNAFDAAIAVAAALGVVEPYSSGLGGGGFWLLYLADDERTVFVDSRETAPLLATRTMYLDARNAGTPDASLNGPLAAAIPGVPAALDHLAAHYGRLPLGRSLAPAIDLARNGFPIDDRYRRMARLRLDALTASPGASSQFLDKGAVPTEGAPWRQPELAATLERIAERGRDGFYTGEIAERLVAGVREAGGIWTPEDLSAYRVIERAPIVTKYRGWTITSAPPPSAGGIGLTQMLNILAGFELDRIDRPARVQLIVEAMRRAYRDRPVFLGDPDQVEIPITRLTHPFYAAGLARDIQSGHASSSLPNPVEARASEGRDTTHFSILDAEGNRVAATLSINYPFGSGFVPPGAGVLLNDEMDDFATNPGAANAYGLVGGEANAIAPGKRMLSSMSPTFAESDQGIAILGTPGGSRIITMVLNAILNLVDGGTPDDWVAAARFHHQFLPDLVQVEPDAFTAETQDKLTAMGYRLEVAHPERFGNMQIVYWDLTRQAVMAASDPRGIGAARILPSSEGTGLSDQ